LESGTTALVASLTGSKLRLFAKAKQYDKAVEYVRERTKRSPDSSLVNLTVAVLIEGKVYDKAEKLLDEHAGKAKGEALERLNQLKLYLYAKSGRLDKLEQVGLKLVRESPKSPTARLLLADLISSEAKKPQRALKLVDGWIKELTPAKPATQPALDDQTQAILAGCREAAVRLLMMQQEYKQAMARADKYLRADPKNTEMLALKSTCLTELGRSDLARAELEKAYKLEPDSVSLNNNLGYMYADRGVKLEQAEKMIKLARKTRPLVLAYMDSLAWVFYKQGRFRQAAKMFQQIIPQSKEEESEHAVLYDHAGDVLYRLGWNDRAAKMWKRAVEIAKEEKRRTAEIKLILNGVPGKIEAVKKGKKAKVAPLGKADAGPKKPK